MGILNRISSALLMVSFSFTASGCILISLSIGQSIHSKNKHLLHVSARDDNDQSSERTDAQAIEEFFSLYEEDQALTDYVNDLGQQVAKQADKETQRQWRFSILDTSIPNAFALPTGHVYVTRGLLPFLQSEAELVAVLGHEVAHVTSEHVSYEDPPSDDDDFGMGIDAARRKQKAQREMMHSREQEYEADRLGVKYMIELGYNPEGAMLAMDSLSRLERFFLRKTKEKEIKEEEEKQAQDSAKAARDEDFDEIFGDDDDSDTSESSSESSENELPEWKRSHPATKDRIRKLLKLTAGGDGKMHHEEYLRRLDGLVFGKNLRNGFFDGRWFVHPEKNFMIGVPKKWDMMNINDKVLLASPDEECMVAFLPSNKKSATSATDGFLNDIELPPGEVWTRKIDGVNYRATGFGSHGGKIQGLVGAIEVGGHIRIFLAFSDGPLWRAKYGKKVFQILSSLRPLYHDSFKDPELMRVQVHELEAPTTIATFKKTTKTNASEEFLELLNRLSENGELDDGVGLSLSGVDATEQKPVERKEPTNSDNSDNTDKESTQTPSLERGAN